MCFSSNPTFFPETFICGFEYTLQYLARVLTRGGLTKVIGIRVELVCDSSFLPLLKLLVLYFPVKICIINTMVVHYRLAWLRFLSGKWDVNCNGKIERIMLHCDFDRKRITWMADKCPPRELDWSWGGFNNTFTLAGGDCNRIIRWRPSVKHSHFDDDHVVWLPYSTKHVMLVLVDMEHGANRVHPC